MKKVVLCLFTIILISSCTATDYTITYVTGNDTLTVTDKLYVFKYRDISAEVVTEIIGSELTNINTLILREPGGHHTICASTDPIHVIELKPIKN